MARLFAAAPANDLPAVPNFNICPTDRIHAVLSGEGRRLVSLRWGFLPNWYDTPSSGPLLINARAETLAEKPAFREACRSRRCLVPMSGFHEWRKGGDGQRLPHYITRADGAPMVVGGIWQDWAPGAEGAEAAEGAQVAERLATCAMVTTAASADIAHIHARMPLILEPEDWPLWLGEAGHGAARLMRPAAAGLLRDWRVGAEVNSNRAEGAGLIVPLAREGGSGDGVVGDAGG